MQVTKAMLQNKIDYLNQITNSPLTAYTKIGESFKSNINHFKLYSAYGAYGLHRIVNEGGGVTDYYVYGLHSKRELLDRLSAFINGIQFSKGL